MQDNDKRLQGLTVLFVDDCPDQRRLYAHVMSAAGADVDLECHGLAAVESVRKAPERYDLVIMDLQMPQFDGLSATIELRSLGFRRPIIAITAFGHEQLRDKWLKAGCCEYMEKPILPQDLIAKVIQVWQSSEPASA